MFRARCAALIGCIFLVTSFVTAYASSSDEREPAVRAALENVSLASVSTEKVQLSVNLSLMSSRNATLREIAFDQLRVNGVPFYASPVSERLTLVSNQKVMPSKPLTLTVYLRDVENLKPLQELVSEGKISVKGMAYADVNLSTAAKVFLFMKRARVSVPIENTVDVQIPGGAVARKAALALLDSAQSGWEHMDSKWQTTAKFFSQWRRQLWDQYAPGLVLAYATYQLNDGAGKTIDLDASAAGFRVTGKQVLLPKSVLEPWKFDSTVAATMKQNSELKVTGYDLWIWPANARLRDESNQLAPPAAWRLSAQQLRLLPFTKDANEKMLVTVDGGHTLKVNVHRRQGASALGLVEITDPAAQSMNATLDDSGRATQFDSVALFRFPGGAEAREAKPDLVFVPASRTGPALQLGTRIDSTGWGSPVISHDGVVGIVINEDSAVSLADAERALNFKPDRVVAGK